MQNEIIWKVCYAYRVIEVISASHVELSSVNDVAETGVSNVEAKLRREDDEWCFIQWAIRRLIDKTQKIKN
jgi:hypothetical protein